MDTLKAIPILKGIIQRERLQGCPMADESLIGPAVRRWNGYDRRNKRNKDKSLKHRTLDLEKGLLALFPKHNYDPACIAHLARSFAEVLYQDHPQDKPVAGHERTRARKWKPPFPTVDAEPPPPEELTREAMYRDVR
jgi:hypothetical protein